MITEKTTDGGTQFLAPFAALQTGMRPFSLGELHDKREAMRDELIKRHGHAALLARLTQPTRDGELALHEAIGVSGAPFGTATARRRAKEFRTLCLYIHSRERQGAPNASPASPASPGEQCGLFDDTTTQTKTAK